MRKAAVKFARWLRGVYDFPIRVPVYLLPGDHITTVDGERGSASFFAPWDRTEEPYIRIATGDYPILKRERGRDNALAAYITSMAHEIVHYQQWIRTGEVSERGVVVKARQLVRRYSETTLRP